MSNTIAAARIRIAIVVDPGGNWAAAGWRGARDAEAIEAATLSTPVDSDGTEQ
jgi:hypothetical protein